MRQSKEESQILWKLELESAKQIQLSPEHQALIDVVTKKIEDYTLTYEEYLVDITNFLKDAPDGVDAKELISDMCNQLIQKYSGSKKIRSEQNQNGSGTIKRGRRSGKNSNNGGTKVL